MILSSVVAVGFLLLASLIGSALVATLGPHARDRDFLTSSAPLLGVAVLLAMLDVVELWVPLRWAAWLIPIVAAVSLGVLVKRRALRWPGALAIVVVLLGVAVGALPTAIVGRPMGALTNDDATYYLAAAEQLVAHPWLEHVNGGEGTACLSEELVHGWLWRTGVANLVGSSLALARVSGPAAISAVTATLMGLVAQASLALGVAAGLRRKPLWRRAIPAAAVVVSAAPAFLGWQHLLGQLAAFAFFPLGLTALARATTHGGIRRFIPAALLLGAAMNTFADSAPVMFLGVVAVLFFGGVRAVGHRLSRAAAVGILAAALFPMTFWRAAWGAYGTVFVRAPAERRGLFPQRGWLERSPIDDVGTLVGVDPWPPWPAPWPLTALAVLQYLAAIAAIILLIAVLWRERRRPGLPAAALSIAVVTIGMIIIISNRYLLGKCLLFEASIIIPAVALAAFVRPNLALKGLFVAWLAGGVAAFAQLARPSGFHVVDDADHDHLAVALERIGPSDVLVLDGFGAPTDTVHDEHRAMRAAHANGIVPIQPGLDGGFFKPRCEDPAVDIFASGLGAPARRQRGNHDGRRRRRALRSLQFAARQSHGAGIIRRNMEPNPRMDARGNRGGHRRRVSLGRGEHRGYVARRHAHGMWLADRRGSHGRRLRKFFDSRGRRRQHARAHARVASVSNTHLLRAHGRARGAADIREGARPRARDCAT